MPADITATARRLMTLFMVVFLFVSGWLVYWQVFWRGSSQGQAVAVAYDQRQCVADNVPQRGSIYDRNGVLLAYSVKDPSAPCGWARHYTDPAFSPVLGYYDPTGYGITGLELAYNSRLSGGLTSTAAATPASQQGIGAGVQAILTNAEHQPRYGDDLYLTLDKTVQDQVYAHFDDTPPSGICTYPVGTVGQPGSIIVEDPQTGAITAMVSYPTFNADLLVNHQPANPAAANGETLGQQYFQQLLTDPNKPLLNRAIQTAVVPGSTFKIMTLIAGFDSGVLTPQTGFDKADASTYTVAGHTFATNNLPALPDSAFPVDLIHLFAYSDNVAYARAAVMVGKPTWLDYAARFGMSYGDQIHTLPFDLPVIPSWVYQPQFQQQWDQDNVLFADTGYGQGRLLVSPLMDTVMIAAIGADGVIHPPHLRLKFVAHGVAATSVPNDPLPAPRRAMSVQTAREVQQAMRAVVSYGTGSLSPRASSSPVLEGGKTGTGDLGFPLPDTQTWWSSLAPIAVDENGVATGKTPRYAVIIQKDRAGEGFCQSTIALTLYEQVLLPDLVASGG